MTEPISQNPNRLTKSRAVLLALFMNGAAFATQQVVIAVVIGSRFGPSGVGILLAAGAVGRVIAPWVEDLASPPGLLARTLGVVTSVALLLSFLENAPLWVMAIFMAPIGCLSVLFSATVMGVAPEAIPAGSSAGMFGQAAGMFAAGLAALVSTMAALAVAFAGVLLLLTVPWFLSTPSTKAASATREPESLRGEWVYPFLLALCSYGPLGLFAALAAAEFGPGWVGPAFLVYAAGSVVAARLTERLDIDPSTGAFLASAGSLLWVFGFLSLPLTLAARFLSGVLLFLAQGTLLRRAGVRGGSAAVTSALVGLGIGAQLAALWCGILAEVSVTLMAATSAGVTALLGVLYRYLSAFRRPAG